MNHPDNIVHGGVAILIKSTLYFQPFSNYHDHIQSYTITIKLNTISITIGAFYSPPRHNIRNTIKNNFIIGGDFNAEHNS